MDTTTEGTPKVPEAEGQAPRDGKPEPSGDRTDKPAEGSIDSLPEWAQRLVKELRAENAGHRKRTKEAEEAGARAAEEQLAAEKKWQELAEKRAGELEAIKSELAAERLTRLRGEVAAAAGLPATLAERLRGSTKEELEADARELKKLIPAQGSPAPGAPSGPNRDGRSKTPDEAKREAVRRRFGISS